jgi:hypothetical protein
VNVSAYATSRDKRRISIPWNVLNSASRGDILDNPVPFIPFKSLDPTHASIGDVYGAFNTILAEQKKGERPLHFSLDRETLHCISVDEEKAKKALEQPSPKKTKRKKTQRVVQSDEDLPDFSPAVPSGNARSESNPVPRAEGQYQLILLQFVAYEQILASSLSRNPTTSSPLTAVHDSDPASNPVAARNVGNTKFQGRKRKGQPEAEESTASGLPAKKLKSNAPAKGKATKSAKAKKMPPNSEPDVPATEPTHDDASTSGQPSTDVVMWQGKPLPVREKSGR